MRFIALTLGFLVASSTVRADNSHSLAVDPRSIDARCRALAMVPRDARTIGPTLEAYVSAANCTVMVRTNAINLAITQDSVDALDAAVRPAIDLLDAVIEQGDFAHQIVALHAKADIYQGLAVRMLASVPSLPPTAYGNVVAAHDSKVRIAAALVRPWRTQALRTHREVTQLAARSPRQVIANNPVLAYVVRDSGMYSAPGIATR